MKAISITTVFLMFFGSVAFAGSGRSIKCHLLFKGGQLASRTFQIDFDSLLDSEALFNKISKKSEMKFGPDVELLKAIPEGSLIVMDRLKDVNGRAEIIRGRLVKVGKERLRVEINGKVQEFYSGAGVEGTSSLAVFPGRRQSQNEGMIVQYNSLLDSAKAFQELSKGGIILAERTDFFRLIPKGSTIIVDYLKDGWGRAQLIVGRLVQVQKNSIRVEVEGVVREIDSAEGIGGITSLAVLP